MKTVLQIVTVCLALLSASAYGGTVPATLSAQSPYDMKATIENLEQAISAHQYRVVRVQGAYQGFAPLNGGPVIIYFCNFNFLHEALQKSMDLGPMLPCRVVIDDVNGKIMVYAPNPVVFKHVLAGDSTFLDKLCDQVTHDYKAILAEGTL
ncbi:MAG: DUF302 domain-containing protein [Betaproteobacteria bacterium]|nr:DUF302 domain-containing protein [Betaproteobacteria bacterium]